MEQFKVLFDKTTSAGKIYALSGLYFYDYSKFKAAVNGLVDSPKKVTQFSECMIGENTVSELIKIESENVVTLRNNKQTIKSWMGANKIIDGFRVDFWGGGYPQRLKEYLITIESQLKRGRCERSEAISRCYQAAGYQSRSQENCCVALLLAKTDL